MRYRKIIAKLHVVVNFELALLACWGHNEAISQLNFTCVVSATCYNNGDGPSGKVRSVAALNINDRIAPVILAQIKVYGSLVNWVRITDWKNTRNKNECHALAMAIDLL